MARAQEFTVKGRISFPYESATHQLDWGKPKKDDLWSNAVLPPRKILPAIPIVAWSRDSKLRRFAKWESGKLKIAPLDENVQECSRRQEIKNLWCFSGMWKEVRLSRLLEVIFLMIVIGTNKKLQRKDRWCFLVWNVRILVQIWKALLYFTLEYQKIVVYIISLLKILKYYT